MVEGRKEGCPSARSSSPRKKADLENNEKVGNAGKRASVDRHVSELRLGERRVDTTVDQG